jgi:flagellar biosynthesis protein FlhB
MADSFQEKTEQPTEKRLSDARKKGQIAQSPEVASCFVILFVSVFLYYSISKGFSSMFAMYANAIGSLDLEITPNSAVTIFSFAVKQWFFMVGPVFAVLVILGASSTFLQTGFMFSFEAMSPKFSAMNPVNGLKKMFSVKSLFEVLKSLIKIAVLAYILHSLIMKELPVILALASQDTISIVVYIAKTCFGLATKVGGVFLFVAGLDYVRQRWQQKKELKMTLQEVKEEAKDRDGNPQIKARIRSLQREMSRKRMMDDVKKADFIVANPTHFAVAIRYVAKEMPAPKIVAKGAGFIAEKIKQTARDNGIMIIENKPVARGLFYAVKVGDYIPEKFYLIVAELLAQVYKRRNRVSL